MDPPTVEPTKTPPAEPMTTADGHVKQVVQVPSHPSPGRQPSLPSQTSEPAAMPSPQKGQAGSPQIEFTSFMHWPSHATLQQKGSLLQMSATHGSQLGLSQRPVVHVSCAQQVPSAVGAFILNRRAAEFETIPVANETK